MRSMQPHYYPAAYVSFILFLSTLLNPRLFLCHGFVSKPFSYTANQVSTQNDDDECNPIIEVEQQQSNMIQMISGKEYRMSSPREWLEYCEAMDGIGGAYTVLRCDVSVRRPDPDPPFVIWGTDFHFDRLKASYNTLISVDTDNRHAECGGVHSDMDGSANSNGHANLALEESQTILHALIQESLRFIKDQMNRGSDAQSMEKDEIVVAMITLLWTPKINKHDAQGIRVRGHIFSNGNCVSRSHFSPSPISASVAFHSHLDNQGAIPTSLSLPSRSRHPYAKLSSWCRSRRPLETYFKVHPDIQEVILTCQGSNQVQLLEGLTSNLFVVYTDGSIRTTTKGVLNGYAQHLILQACDRSDSLVINHSPILLEHGIEGQWAEVFMTSSVRLVIPVGKIYAPMYNAEKDQIEMMQVWNEKSLSEVSWNTRRRDIVWNLLMDRVQESSTE